MKKKLLNLNEAVAFSGMNANTLLKYVRQNELVMQKMEGDEIGFLREDLIKFVHNRLATLDELNIIEKTVSYRDFEIEKYAKNQAYYFILSNGLFDKFAEFHKNYRSTNPHNDCIEHLCMMEDKKQAPLNEIIELWKRMK